MGELRIRLASTEDVADINTIYNHYVERSTCTFQFDPDSLDDTADWFAQHDGRHPVTVAQSDGEVVGWASLSRFRTRCAYENTVENSIYVRRDKRRQGIGRALLADLIERARGLGHHTIVACISADQPGSIALHEAMGFQEAGHLREVGRKHDTWLGVVFMQLMLDETA